MILTLHYTDSSDNTINKSLDSGVVFNINLPKINNLSNFNVKIKSSLDLFNFNYCHISNINKYYFIDDVSKSNDFWHISLKIDVLESYKNVFLDGSFLFKAKVNTLNGSIDLDPTGNYEYENIVSSVELERGDNSILSVLRWGW